MSVHLSVLRVEQQTTVKWHDQGYVKVTWPVFKYRGPVLNADVQVQANVICLLHLRIFLQPMKGYKAV